MRGRPSAGGASSGGSRWWDSWPPTRVPFLQDSLSIGRQGADWTTRPCRHFGPARHGMVSSWSLFFQGGTHAEASLYHRAAVGLIGRPLGGVRLERDAIADALPECGALGVGPGVGPGIAPGIAQRVALGITVLDARAAGRRPPRGSRSDGRGHRLPLGLVLSRLPNSRPSRWLSRLRCGAAGDGRNIRRWSEREE